MSEHSCQKPPTGFDEGRYHPLLGTDVRILAWAGDRDHAVAAHQAALAEMVRLQDVFSIYDQTSAISRWRRGEDLVMPVELTAALGEARHWFDGSGHAFHPASRVLHERWQRAAREGVVPTRGEMQELADSIAALPWQFGADASEERIGDCSGVDLNAFAKGFIVDQAVCAATSTMGLVRIGVNAGGDLQHLTNDESPSGRWRVGVEDPLHPSDNGADRLCTIAIGSQAVATSGLARRGFRVGDQWFGHVIDPRTGWPVSHLAQVSVVAPDAGIADALATICGVLPIEEALAFVETEQDCEALLVSAEGSQHRSLGWDAYLVG